jgi:hypothetical protein
MIVMQLRNPGLFLTSNLKETSTALSFNRDSPYILLDTTPYRFGYSHAAP